MPQSSLMTWLNNSEISDQRDNLAQTTSPKCSLETGKTAGASHAVNDIPDGQTQHHAQSPIFGTRQQPLSPNVEFRACTKDDISQLKHLTGLLLPIPYPEKFFKEIIDNEVINSITLLAFWHDDPQRKGKEKGRLVGAVRCRLLTQPAISEKHAGSPMLYLSTLALLSPYRGHGIATHLLKATTKRAVEDYGVTSIGAHVWEANTEGLTWYQKRGFREVRHEAGYYRRLDPQTAVVLQRDIGVLDLLEE